MKTTTQERRVGLALELLGAARRARALREAWERGEPGARERYMVARSDMEAMADAAELELAFGQGEPVPA